MSLGDDMDDDTLKLGLDRRTAFKASKKRDIW